MRTNIILNDSLVKQAFKLSGLKTKKSVIDLALREFVQHHNRLDLRKLIGKIEFDPKYDYKKIRIRKHL